MSAGNPRPAGGRRIPTAAATGVAAITGAALIASALTGAGGGGDPPPAPQHDARTRTNQNPPPATPSHAAAPAALPRSEPVAVHIDAIGVHADTIVALGLAPDGAIEVPADYAAVGWYHNGPTPGQAGPAVIAGHVDSDTGPAVFYRLGDLQPGDDISVERADGTTATFTVYALRQYPKDHFPTRQVYGPTGGRAELRLITCGGGFDRSAQTYRRNTIAYAQLAPPP